MGQTVSVTPDLASEPVPAHRSHRRQRRNYVRPVDRDPGTTRQERELARSKGIQGNPRTVGGIAASQKRKIRSRNPKAKRQKAPSTNVYAFGSTRPLPPSVIATRAIEDRGQFRQSAKVKVHPARRATKLSRFNPFVTVVQPVSRSTAAGRRVGIRL